MVFNWGTIHIMSEFNLGLILAHSGSELRINEIELKLLLFLVELYDNFLILRIGFLYKELILF